jgi:hypothetical protein
MPSVEFEPMIPTFERAKTIHASDRGATVTGVSGIPYQILKKKGTSAER